MKHNLTKTEIEDNHSIILTLLTAEENAKYQLLALKLCDYVLYCTHMYIIK